MDFDKLKECVKLSHFLPNFCGIEYSSRTRHKMRGTDANDKPLDFTEQEKRKIRAGLKKMFDYIKQIE